MYSRFKSSRRVSRCVDLAHQLLTSQTTTAIINAATPCAGEPFSALFGDVVAVALLLPVVVEDPVGLVTVAVVDPVRLEDDLDEVEAALELPGSEMLEFPGDGVAAPDETPLSVAVCPLHAAFPCESREHVSPAAVSSRLSESL